jgi:hydroxymethylpyrimidine/phosphomethylpyrimidine kinase
MSKPPVVWTVAGFDPSCGAGIGADLKTISSFDCYGVACITAMTVQNTLGVRRVEPLSAATVRETLQALLEDLPPSAIKIGMLATAEIASVVADFLEALSPLTGTAAKTATRCPVVLDPILRSSSGAELLDAAGVEVLRRRLLPLASVITPNRHEAAALTRLPAGDAEAAAQALRRLGAASVVVTGGDPLAANPTSTAESCSQDVMAYSASGLELIETLSAPRLRSSSTHGTGCAFSSAIACALALGQPFPAAVTNAKSFVYHAIERAPGLGHGRGPLCLDRGGQ